MRHARNGFGGGAPAIGDFKIGTTVVAGQPVIWLTTGSGTVEDPASTTDLTNAFGVVLGAAQGQTLTFSSTQGDTEGVATVVYDPMAIIQSRVVPSSTSDTAYADEDGYFITNTSANTAGTTVTDSDITGSADDMNDGMIFCLTGANPGQSRVITDHTATTVVVTVPFTNDIDVGDTFLASQYAPGVIGATMTSDFTQLDGTDAGGAAGEAVIVNVFVKTNSDGATLTAPQLFAEFVFQDHAFNSVA